MKTLAIVAAAMIFPCAAVPTSALAAPIINFTGQTGTFQNFGIEAGEFDDSYTFSVADMGAVSGTITSVAIDGVTNVDFSSVLLNGVEFTNLLSGDTEFRSILRLPVSGGEQSLRVRGQSQGRGSYAGTLAFSTTPVPEPAGWTTMLLALGLLGAGLKMSSWKGRAASPKAV